ncbi:hypothetical protein FHG87_016084 [Trinorchestia longiramus]|nr:hypothetical protein FHG87_016084 [Trinorchestia longiramus]
MKKTPHRATKMISELFNLSYKRHVLQLELDSLEQRIRQGQLIETYKYLNGLNDVTLEGFFHRNRNVGTRNPCQKLTIRNSKTSHALNLHPIKIIKTWNQLLESIVSAGSVNTLKNCQ